MSSDLKKINKSKKNSRRNTNVQEPKFVERLIKISRVSKVTKGGKKIKFSSNCSNWKRKWKSWCWCC
jgi:ribosomal protein S5